MILKTFTILALACVSLHAQVIGTSNSGSAEQSSTISSNSNQVIQWNRTLLMIVRTPGAQPPTVHSTRSFAMMHAAIYDAVNNIDKTHSPYLVRLHSVSAGASQEAASAAAAHSVLVSLYPKFQAYLDARLKQALAKIPDGPKKSEGIRVGLIVGDRVLLARSKDGSELPPPIYIFGDQPGDYQSTPPNFPKQPQFTGWSRVVPFTLQRAKQFRPGPPPALTSDEYAAVFNEVKSLGIMNGQVATYDQKFTGRFWNGAIQNYWNEIAQTAALRHDLTVAESARLFALLNLAFADDVIAFYDAKYTYNFWRPVTAIRKADTDGNPNTVVDPDWLPEVGKTTPDPSYPGAHAVISATGAFVLDSFFKDDHFDFIVTSEVIPGAARSFTSFSAASKEATLSRIFAGVHLRSDLTSGQRLGRNVAGFVVDHYLLPVHANNGGQ
jgi:hypothetical protein